MLQSASESEMSMFSEELLLLSFTQSPFDLTIWDSCKFFVYWSKTKSTRERSLPGLVLPEFRHSSNPSGIEEERNQWRRKQLDPSVNCFIVQRTNRREHAVHRQSTVKSIRYDLSVNNRATHRLDKLLINRVDVFYHRRFKSNDRLIGTTKSSRKHSR